MIDLREGKGLCSGQNTKDLQGVGHEGEFHGPEQDRYNGYRCKIKGCQRNADQIDDFQEIPGFPYQVSIKMDEEQPENDQYQCPVVNILFIRTYNNHSVTYLICVASTLEGVSVPAMIVRELRAMDFMILAILFISSVPISSPCV